MAQEKVMKIYILGCGGMLGDAVYKHFSENHKVLATDLVANHTRMQVGPSFPPIFDKWLEYRDVRDYHAMHYDCSEFQPDVIMNLAAMTDLEECESYTRNAIDTNASGSMNCAMLAMKRDIPYV